LCLYLVSTM